MAERFGAKARVETTKRELIFDFPFGPLEAVEFFRKYFGPTQMAFARLDAACQKALADELTNDWAAHNGGDAQHTLIKAEYLEVHAGVA